MKAPFRPRLSRIISPVAALLLAAASAGAQVITVDTKTGAVTGGIEGQAPVDRRYQQIQPTQVDLPRLPLGATGRSGLIRALQAEQGFAMRPFPKGHKGLTLAANGKLAPFGEAYVKMVTDQGLSAKPGDRVVVTDIKFERDKIIFDLNGGPDKKHRLLSHLQIGVGPNLSPVASDDDQEPTGARLTLTFPDGVPEVSGAQVKALLAPMISFDVKTPIQAFTDTLPAKLREAILNHQVMVGMTIEMVLFAKGRPESKSREMEGQMPFEEWIYGRPPQPIEFIRINGNRVIRMAVAKNGEKPVVTTQDEVSPLMQSNAGADGNREQVHSIRLGDTEQNSDRQSPAPPPSLHKAGEPGSEMKPVRFPAPKPASGSEPGANPDEEPAPQ